MGDLSPHFSTHEFRCKCVSCRDKADPFPISPELIQVLEAVRDYAGYAIKIESGFRCPSHNRAVGGTPQSAHLSGEAADIRIRSDHERFKFIEAATMAGVSRLGIGRTFLHVDVSKRLSQEVCWGYWD